MTKMYYLKKNLETNQSFKLYLNFRNINAKSLELCFSTCVLGEIVKCLVRFFDKKINCMVLNQQQDIFYFIMCLIHKNYIPYRSAYEYEWLTNPFLMYKTPNSTTKEDKQLIDFRNNSFAG